MTRIAIDTNRNLGSLDRRVYGGFVEHLGRCIYGGLYEEGSPLADDRGFRLDTLALLKDLRLSVLRWPGGNFVSNYHWQDGIGPKDTRPVRPELAWGGTESNRFGTDEYIEYCNSERATYWADKRRANGHDAPHGVSWWGLGNEIYGPWQVGAKSAEEYVAEAVRWARAIKMIDPTVRLVSCGELGWTDWDRKVIDGLAPHVALHSLHLYTGSDDYWTNQLAPHATERAIETTVALLKRAAYNQKLEAAPRIVYDEWNVWFRDHTGALEERYVFHDALAVGTYLNVFVRNCAWVTMANLAQMVNAIAPVVTTPETAVVQPIYYPFLLHAQGHLARAVDAFVDGPVVEAPAEQLSRWPHRVDDLGPFSLVDAAATVDEGMTKLACTLVNRSEEPEEVELSLRDGAFTGTARLRTVTGTGRRSPVPGVEEADVSEGSEKASGSSVTLVLPARSFTLVEVALARV